ncbi:MAG: helix-turn-helix domain-containing protein [Acidimicrobiia bacterium]|nr:helix-turn-helix domain-containing protein [Acidimicrobiia bacterium]
MRVRSYQLLCPVARSLDVLGDRWTLLLLRDLHAGPAGFTELQRGLGMATNLLSTRLRELVDAGMVEKTDDAYALTEVGRSTDRVLWELVRFGSTIDRDPHPKEPGNLRTIALPLRMMLLGVADRPSLTVWLDVDDEEFQIVTTTDDVVVRLRQPSDELDGVDLHLRTEYVGFLDLAERRISLSEFAHDHREIVHGGEHLPAFAAMIARALELAHLG